MVLGLTVGDEAEARPDPQYILTFFYTFVVISGVARATRKARSRDCNKSALVIASMLIIW